VILFAGSPLSGLARVVAQGGETVAVTTVEASEIGHRYPSFLPDGRRFLYLAKSADPQKTGVYVGDLDTATRARLPGVSSNAVYSRLGYLFFVREQTIVAQRFDASSGRIIGEAIPLAQGVDYFPGENEGMFSASVHDGEPNILAYTSGWFDAALRLTWFDPQGTRTTSVGSPGAIVRSPRLSAAGNAVAFERLDAQTGTFEIWIHDLNRGTDSPFTADGRNNVNPVWSPDGGYLAFASFRGTPDASTGGLPFPKVFRKSTTGVVAEELLHDAQRPTWPTDWSRDGRYIVETIQNGNGQRDIWLLPLFGDQKAYPFVDTGFDERDGRVSADSRFIAYVSNEGRRDEVFLETFPTRTSRQQVSTSGGTRPVWSRDGRELYFISSDQTQTNYLSSAGTLMVASIRQDGRVDPPRSLFKTRGSAFDVARDGRILTTSQTEQAYAAPMSIVLNWPALLRK
jgi:Tol biopolymer transport system component